MGCYFFLNDLSNVSRIMLVCAVEQTGLSLTWSQYLETGFLVASLKFRLEMFFLIVHITKIIPNISSFGSNYSLFSVGF